MKPMSHLAKLRRHMLSEGFIKFNKPYHEHNMRASITRQQTNFRQLMVNLLTLEYKIPSGNRVPAVYGHINACLINGCRQTTK